MARGNGTARWTAATAKRVLDEWTASGESLGGFARRRGVQAQRLSWWRKRLGWAPTARGGASVGTIAPWVPVTVAGDAQTGATSAAATIELGHAIRVELRSLDRASAAWVATLARALGAAS